MISIEFELSEESRMALQQVSAAMVAFSEAVHRMEARAGWQDASKEQDAPKASKASGKMTAEELRQRVSDAGLSAADVAAGLEEMQFEKVSDMGEEDIFQLAESLGVAG